MFQLAFAALLTKQVSRKNGKWKAWHPDPNQSGASSGYLLFPGLPFSLLDRVARSLSLTRILPTTGIPAAITWNSLERIQALSAMTSLTGLHSACSLGRCVSFNSSVPTSKRPSLAALSVPWSLSQHLALFSSEHLSPSSLICLFLAHLPS